MLNATVASQDEGLSTDPDSGLRGGSTLTGDCVSLDDRLVRAEPANQGSEPAAHVPLRRKSKPDELALWQRMQQVSQAYDHRRQSLDPTQIGNEVIESGRRSGSLSDKAARRQLPVVTSPVQGSAYLASESMPIPVEHTDGGALLEVLGSLDELCLSDLETPIHRLLSSCTKTLDAALVQSLGQPDLARERVGCELVNFAERLSSCVVAYGKRLKSVYLLFITYCLLLTAYCILLTTCHLPLTADC